MVLMARLDSEQINIRKLSLVGRKTYTVTIPIGVIRLLKWQKGENIQVRRQGKMLILERQENK